MSTGRAYMEATANWVLDRVLTRGGRYGDGVPWLTFSEQLERARKR